MTDRRRSEPCKVIRPARPGDPLDDTDENPAVHDERPISVSRTRTPADETLQLLLIDGLDELPTQVRLALEAVARRGAEDRESLEKRVARAESKQSRWQRLAAGLKAIGVGSVVASLAVVAQALIAHGDRAAVSRQQADTVREHGAAISKLKTDLDSTAKDLKADVAALRAQAAADHALLSIFAARLSAATQP